MSGRMAPLMPLASDVRGEPLEPDAEGDVVVGHDRDRDTRRRALAASSRIGGGVTPFASTTVVGLLDDGPVHHRIGERDPDLDGVGTGFGGSPNRLRASPRTHR